jgi:signal transduction histidine kinase
VVFSPRVLDGTELVVSVRDDGTGLPHGLAAAPFQPGRRSEVASAGSGLGLSIARAIVDAHGGWIELETLERGTGFCIHLPIEAPGRGEEGGDG